MQLFDHIQILMTSSGLLIVAALMFATWLPSALKSSFHQCQWPKFKPTVRTMTNLATQALCWQGGKQAGRQAPTSCYLPSSGHTFFVKLRFSLQEIVTKDEDKKTITCPEQLISVSCICMSAKILPYTETLRWGPSKPVQGRKALSTEWT